MKMIVYVNRVLVVGFTKNKQTKAYSYILTDDEFFELYPRRYDRCAFKSWILSKGDVIEVFDFRVEMLDELFDFRVNGKDYFMKQGLSMESTIQNATVIPVEEPDTLSVRLALLPALRQEFKDFLNQHSDALVRSLGWMFDTTQK